MLQLHVSPWRQETAGGESGDCHAGVRDRPGARLPYSEDGGTEQRRAECSE